MNLQEIYSKWSSNGDDCGFGDKGTVHNYIESYNELLSPYQNQSNVLEIGLANGHSLEMWFEFFQNSNIYGIDITDQGIKHLIKDPRFSIVIGDACNTNTFDNFKDIKFDVVIDDGSHILEHQIKTFDILKNRMKEGGIYIIEDVTNLDEVRHIFQQLHTNCEIRDTRDVKDRYDDVLIIYKF
jgi:spermidine synthase